MGNTYLISDIHNDVYGFKCMLQRISFNPEEDRMFILGDVFDLGPEKAYELYQEIKKYEDCIQVLKGNHENWLQGHIENYCHHGIITEFESTLSQLLHLSKEELLEIAEWISQMPLYLYVEVHDRTYMLAHAQTSDRPEGEEEELFLQGSNLHAFYTSGGLGKHIISVVGHRSVGRIRTMLRQVRIENRIWMNKEGNIIAIDCGNSYRDGGTLGCLRLDDMKEFYIDKEIKK